MDSPRKDLEAYRARLVEARLAIEASRWAEAKPLLVAAIAIDPLEPAAYELLAKVMDGLHDPDEAEALRRRAKIIRQEKWQREVEAEVRGRHELIGGPARHEIP